MEHENAASSYKLKQTIDSLKVEKTALYDKSQESIKQFEAFKFNSETQFKELENTIKAKDIFINDLQTQLDKQASNLAPKEEISRLQDEVSALKEKLDENSHLDKMISQLKHELEMRPTFEELAELQKSIEEIEILHKSETDERDKELHEVMKLKRELEMELEATKKELNELREEMITSNSRGRIADLTKDSTINSTEASINVGLPIYTPNAPIDPSSGKEKWCGLCERDGHDSLHCPYENDMF